MQSNWWPNMGVLNKLNVNTYSVYSNQSITNVDGDQSMSVYSGMMSDRCYLSSSIQNFFLKVSNTRCYCIPGWSWYLLMLNYLTKHKLGSKTWVWDVLNYWYLTFVTTEGGCTVHLIHGFIVCSYRLTYPRRTKSGSYAELILTTYCLNDKYYDLITDSCQ